jgi:hypothetical protein
MELFFIWLLLEHLFVTQRSYKMYKLTKFPNQVFRVLDNTFIPFDPDNTDYQEYLKWVAEGNTPEPADE